MDKPARALVPEHSLPLMQAMSGAKPLLIEPYQFFHRDDWLLAIGYPLSGQYDNAAFTQAIAKAARKT
ncbi:MAG: GNAT family N-acetyltransferase, partial [Desulfovibrio sp.]|nr:GNAT family N-acetyltransferase [Desulfovibrio sp.]